MAALVVLPPASSRIVVPVRYAAWLSGDLGRTLERTLQHALDPLEDVRVSRLPRGFLVEANEAPGPSWRRCTAPPSTWRGAPRPPTPSSTTR